MKNYINKMPQIEGSHRATSFGVTAIIIGILCLIIYMVLNDSRFYIQFGVGCVSVGFPTLLAGLVCDHMSRVYNLYASKVNSKD